MQGKRAGALQDGANPLYPIFPAPAAPEALPVVGRQHQAEEQEERQSEGQAATVLSLLHAHILTKTAQMNGIGCKWIRHKVPESVSYCPTVSGRGILYILALPLWCQWPGGGSPAGLQAQWQHWERAYTRHIVLSEAWLQKKHYQQILPEDRRGFTFSPGL